MMNIRMNISLYKEFVVNHYQNGAATELDWKFLGEVMLNASESGSFDFRDIDSRILNKSDFEDYYPEESDEI